MEPQYRFDWCFRLDWKQLRNEGRVGPLDTPAYKRVLAAWLALGMPLGVRAFITARTVRPRKKAKA